MLKNLNLPTKFLILGVLVVISVGFPSKLLYDVEQGLIDVSNQEMDGVAPLNDVSVLIQDIQSHRTLSSAYLDASGMAAELATTTATVLQAFDTLQPALKDVYPDSPMHEHFANAKDAFVRTVNRVQSFELSPEASYRAHSVVIDELMSEVIPHILEASGLSYDPVAETYHLIIANNQNLPFVIEGAKHLKGIVNGYADSATLEIAGPLRDVHHNLEAAFEATGDERIAVQLRKFESLQDTLSGLINSILSRSATAANMATVQAQLNEVPEALYALKMENNVLLAGLLQERVSTAEQLLKTHLSIILAVVLLAALLSILVIKVINAAVKSQLVAIKDIASGKWDISLDTKRSDEFGSVNKGLADMAARLQDAKDQSDAQQSATASTLVESTRIQEALKATSTNVMIADADRNILFMNKSVTEMLRKVESELRQALPHFAVDKIIGSNMDIFHKDPSHQKHLLEALKRPYQSNIVVGSLHFRLTANPIFDADGERIGSVVEWLDRTAEVKAEQEIGNIVNQAAAGNFTLRVKEDDKKDFMLFMAQSLNQLMSTADEGLTDVSRVLMALSEGDLSERITNEYQGQFDNLKRYCNDTSENLAKMIGQIRSAAETINIAAAEIAQGNSDLSNRTETQASSLEETASSMEQMTSTVRLNADNADEANKLASQASTVATEGGQLISQVVTMMSSINESSRKISDIIGVIDGIAFQTNILALNAAVEAARAGEQGRGFAVVASEVRTLAQRSANAAKDIKDLISDSVSKIDNGNALVNQSGETMGQIVEAIKRVNMIMSEIAAASSEQASGIDEINHAVTQMDEMTQQNAALVEEAAASAESMRSQAAALEGQVSKFIIDGAHTPKTATLSLESKVSAKPMVAKTKATPKADTTSMKKTETKGPSSPLDDSDWEEF